MTFVDLCVAAVFEVSYNVEQALLPKNAQASKECRALTRLFRQARHAQPQTLNGIRHAMQRSLLEYVGRKHPDPRLVSVETIGGVRCHRIKGPNAICVVHGGGFVGGDWGGYQGYCNAISAISNRGVLFVDYDTTAKHPTQVAEVAAVLEILNPDLVVADSAGGHLVLCAYEDTGVCGTRTILFSPVVDPTCTSASFKRNGTCYINNVCKNGDPVGEAMLHPYVTATLLKSVTTRCVEKAPPNTIVYASENELFADDARYLQTLGAELHLYPAIPGGAFHAWPLWNIPEASTTLQHAFL